VRVRQTRQLTAIESALRSARRPLAIAEIHAAAGREFPGIGVATVYRAIRELTKAGRIVGLTYAGQPMRYEWVVRTHHAHFICQGCQRLFDVRAPQKIPLPKPRPKSFEFTGDEVIYYGYCPECRDRH